MGANKLVSTSAHIPYADLERIEELGESPSRFIREAVAEKLEREEGYVAAIARKKADIEDLTGKLSGAEEQLKELREKQAEWIRDSRIREVKDAMISEYFSQVYKDPGSLSKAVQGAFEDVSPEDVLRIAKEVWKEFGGV